VRSILACIAVAVAIANPLSPRALAEPRSCDHPECVPGITPDVVLGTWCTNTTYFVFATTSWGRLVFCGSPRRYEPRYFRSPPMVGIKDLDSPCTGLENDVAQAPDGLFLSCLADDGAARWVRGDT